MKAPFLFWSEETGLTCPTPGVPYMPFRCTPAHSSAPGTTAHDRQQGRPCQNQGRPHKARHTRPDDGHAGTLEGVRSYVACATFLYACTFNLEYTIDLYV